MPKASLSAEPPHPDQLAESVEMTFAGAGQIVNN
jgi:hypothetical protein